MSIETVHEELLSEIDDGYDKYPGGFTYDITKPTAVKIAGIEAKSSEVINKIDIKNLTGDELEEYIFQRTGLKRIAATHAIGPVKIVTTGATVINIGDLVAADDVFYTAEETLNIFQAGTYSLNVKCQLEGVVGNVPVGAINSFPVTLSNVMSVMNEVAFTNGYEKETEESLISRYYAKLQRPGKAGNPFHYEEWATSRPGVGRVKVDPLWNGPLTVKITILNADNQLASQELIDDVYEYIMREKPFGARPTVVTGQHLTIAISADFILKQGYSWAIVKPLLETHLNRYLRGITFDADIQYISYARIGRELLEVEGIVDYSNLLINGAETNIQLGYDDVPIIGEITDSVPELEPEPEPGEVVEDE